MTPSKRAGPERAVVAEDPTERRARGKVTFDLPCDTIELQRQATGTDHCEFAVGASTG